MANYSYSDLKHKTVAQLREIAKGIEHEAVQGATQMNKERLLAGVCKALGISLETTFTSNSGRPMKIANSGKVIKELFA